MTRKELFTAVKENNFQDAIKAMYGTDYTHVSNKELEKFITFRLQEKEGDSTSKDSKDTQETIVTDKPIQKEEGKKVAEIKETESPYEAAFVIIATLLEQQGLLDNIVTKAKEACKRVSSHTH